MRAVLLACVLVVPVSASAQSLRHATETFAVAATADWMSTKAFLNRGGHEGNPMLKWAEDTPQAMIALGATADVVTVWTLHKTLGKKRPKLAAIGLYAASAVRVWLTARNMRLQDRRQPRPWGGFPTSPSLHSPFVRSPGRP